MDSGYFFQLPSYLLVLILFPLAVLFNWLGYLYKKKRLQKFPGEDHESTVTLEGAMLGILFLLMGFTFSMAISKFEKQRQLIVEEANAIGTAILRCDMYPDSVRNLLRADFKEYIEARIGYYEAGINEERINGELSRVALISDRIWKKAAKQAQDKESIVRSAQMIPALNSMIDIVTTRDAERISKVPPLVLWILLILILIFAFVLGTNYSGKRRNRILTISFAIVMTLSLTLIAELNRPRSGFINLNKVEQKIVALRELVK